MKEKMIDRRQAKNREIRELVKNSKLICSTFFNGEYVYSEKEAVEELGLDDDLVHQLVEDYVSQIIKTLKQFETLLSDLQKNKDIKTETDYRELRDLAHKNLGVARNLRIKDSEKILHDMMTKDDVEHLFVCLKTLEACVICLKPTCAYDTMKLIEVKNKHF